MDFEWCAFTAGSNNCATPLLLLLLLVIQNRIAYRELFYFVINQKISSSDFVCICVRMFASVQTFLGQPNEITLVLMEDTILSSIVYEQAVVCVMRLQNKAEHAHTHAHRSTHNYYTIFETGNMHY